VPVPVAGRRAGAPLTTTAERLLDAAERLFARRGYTGTSVRDITNSAACNVAGINYYFGSKDRLYHEVFRRRFAELRNGQMSVLDGLAGVRTRAPALEDVLAAFAHGFVAPLAAAGPGRAFVELMLREMVEPRLPPRMFFNDFVEPLEQRLATAMCAAVPRLTPPAARRCVRSLVAQLLHEVHALRQPQARGSSSLRQATLEDTLQHIVRFTAAGIRAAAKGDQ
jgi:AcrR family transcriptional regulator